MTDPGIEEKFQRLFDGAILGRVVPGAQFVVFNKDRFLVNGVSGYSTLPTPDNPDGLKARFDDVHKLASGGKITVSVLALIILERKLVKNEMGLEDLDDHEKFAETVPEFRKGSGSLVNKIIVGYEPDLSPDGQRVPVLKDVNGKVTLRMLLTHTAGFAYPFNNELIAKLVTAPPGGKALLGNLMVTGLVEDFTYPQVVEPGTTVSYGVATDWIGQWLVRGTGKSLRALFKEYIFDPLGISPIETDTAETDIIKDRIPMLYNRSPDGSFTPLYSSNYSEESIPPPGYAHVATRPIWSSTQSYCKFLQAILRKDSKLLSESSWELAMKDDLTLGGLCVPRPRWKSSGPYHCDIDIYIPQVDPHGKSSMNLLQCELSPVETLTGSGPGFFAWAGSFNTYYGIDPYNGLGWMFSTQTCPFFDPKVVDLRDTFEKLIHQMFPRQN